MAKRPTEKETEKNIERVLALVEKMPEPRRTKVKKMLGGRVGEIYFTCPASSREDFHSCYPGGLAQHSLNLLDNLRKLTETLCPGRYPDHQLIFVALFHDLGKVGDGVEEYYRPNPSDWHRNKGMLYEINKDCQFMPTSERGLYVLQKNGIGVDAEEYLAIRLNDGQYDETNRAYRMKEPPLALLVHMADLWATVQEKDEIG